ncbi:MAG: DNA recombination protein RmuC [Acidobacteriota bacterium]|nr:DNA recombination protein RmuC [Acidobacteriota bacterium]MDH3522483.1 DNA recombination protein RmuC [Acidobacteriota bacterium]
MFQQAAWVLPGLFALGLLVGWAVGYALGGRRGQRRLIASVQELSVAETTARAERERRAEAESELRATEARLSELDRELAVARERVATGAQLLAEQKRFIESSRKELEDAFQSLAAAALKGTSEQFLTLAQQRLETTRTRATADLEERRQAVENLVAPLRETLDRLDRKTTDLERSRAADASKIGEQVEQLARSTSLLRDETTSLSAALRGTEIGGRWGELALRRVAEIAGMTAHCDFEEQLTIAGGARPDMVVNLPEKRRIAVDAKAPLGAFLEASNARDDAGRRAALDRHAKGLRGHVRQLAQRDYAASLGEDTEFVILFLPADAFLGAAFQADPDLQVDALRSKVLLATPTTLVALLRTIAIYWQQRSMAENAEAIAVAARELYERAAKFGAELSAVGRGLATALDAYDRAVGSFDRRLMPMAAKLEEMKVAEGSRRELTAPELVGRRPRPSTT